MNNLRTCTIAGIGLLMAGLVLAHPERGQRPGESDERFGEHNKQLRLEKMAEVLDLDEGQKAQVEAIMEEAHQRHADQREMVKAKHEQLSNLLDSESADSTEVGALMIEMHQSRQQLDAARAQVHAEIAALLTPAQQERFEAVQEMRSERGDHRRGGRDHRQGHQRGRSHN